MFPSCSKVQLAWQVQVAGYPAHVRYVGETHFAPGEWIGVELEPGGGLVDIVTNPVELTRYFNEKKAEPLV